MIFPIMRFLLLGLIYLPLIPLLFFLKMQVQGYLFQGLWLLLYFCEFGWQFVMIHTQLVLENFLKLIGKFR